jgi:hypothetical protein
LKIRVPISTMTNVPITWIKNDVTSKKGVAFNNFLEI